MSLLEKYSAQYPELFSSCFEVYLPFGWISIIESRLPDIDRIRKESGLPVQVAQIKEKFGGLRFYVDFLDNSIFNKVHDIIDQMEKEAAVTCQDCGVKAGATTSADGGCWVRTRCDLCRKGN